PSSTSSAACTIASASRASRRPVSLCVSAAAFLIHTCATTNGRKGVSPLIAKFSRARTVWTPYSASAGTCFGPSGSFSVRKASAIVSARGRVGKVGRRARDRHGSKCKRERDAGGDGCHAEHRHARTVQTAKLAAPGIVRCQLLDRPAGIEAQAFDAGRDDQLRDQARDDHAGTGRRSPEGGRA